MKESEIIRMSDGTIIRKFANGFVFEGYADGRYEPLSGTITTPEGVKYDIPNFNGENVYDVFKLIKQGKLKNYIKNYDETV